MVSRNAFLPPIRRIKLFIPSFPNGIPRKQKNGRLVYQISLSTQNDRSVYSVVSVDLQEAHDEDPDHASYKESENEVQHGAITS